MSTITQIVLPENSDATFFDNQSLRYFVPEISCITKLKKSASKDSCRFTFSFTVYLKYGVNFELGFSSYKEGRAARDELLSKLAQYTGPDNVVFSCGHNSEVTIINAIDDITELFIKDERAAFSIFVKHVPFPLHIVGSNLERTRTYYRYMKNSIELERRQNAMEFKKVAVC